VIAATITRFIVFDGSGLVLLVIALWLVQGEAKQD
jgi:hypothetical protein